VELEIPLLSKHQHERGKNEKLITEKLIINDYPDLDGKEIIIYSLLLPSKDGSIALALIL
jgi:hypothetical protein